MKEDAIMFYKWMNRLHYTGIPKVKLMKPATFNGKEVKERSMTVDELYDLFDSLPQSEKKTAFLD